jgi:hypothetical protein
MVQTSEMLVEGAISRLLVTWLGRKRLHAGEERRRCLTSEARVDGKAPPPRCTCLHTAVAGPDVSAPDVGNRRHVR